MISRAGFETEAGPKFYTRLTAVTWNCNGTRWPIPDPPLGLGCHPRIILGLLHECLKNVNIFRDRILCYAPLPYNMHIYILPRYLDRSELGSLPKNQYPLYFTRPVP